MPEDEETRKQRFRELLDRKRLELLAEGDNAIVNDSRTDFLDKVDQDAAPLSEMNQVIASNRNRARALQLEEIAAALVRLEEDPDLFGFCEVCDDEIKPRRMELVPWSKLCIRCQEAQERGDAPASRKHLTDYK